MKKPYIKYLQFVMQLSIAKDPLVYYITEHLEYPKIMIYSQFVKYLLGKDSDFNINDKRGILKDLDSYKNIYLDNLTGEYSIVEQDKQDFKKVTHSELLKFNSNEQKSNTWVNKGLERLQNKLNQLRGSFDRSNTIIRRRGF